MGPTGRHLDRQRLTDGRIDGQDLQGGPKNVALYFCPYLYQLLIDFQNFFIGTLCRQFAIM